MVSFRPFAFHSVFHSTVEVQCYLFRYSSFTSPIFSMGIL